MKNKGFSVLEIMIVVAILGILASIAIPIYRDFMDRAKVSEAVALLGGLRTPMTEYYQGTGTWPSNVAMVGKDRGKYVSFMYAGDLGNGKYYIDALMRSEISENIGGKHLRNYFYSTRSGRWECTYRDVPNPIPTKYLPSSCQD